MIKLNNPDFTCEKCTRMFYTLTEALEYEPCDCRERARRSSEVAEGKEVGKEVGKKARGKGKKTEGKKE
jgi:hypothetical protein